MTPNRVRRRRYRAVQVQRHPPFHQRPLRRIQMLVAIDALLRARLVRNVVEERVRRKVAAAIRRERGPRVDTRRLVFEHLAVCHFQRRRREECLLIHRRPPRRWTDQIGRMHRVLPRHSRRHHAKPAQARQEVRVRPARAGKPSQNRSRNCHPRTGRAEASSVDGARKQLARRLVRRQFLRNRTIDQRVGSRPQRFQARPAAPPRGDQSSEGWGDHGSDGNGDHSSDG